MPALASWPGRIPAGSVCSETAMTMDLLPTLVALAGGSMAASPSVCDGVNLASVLMGKGRLPERTLFWRQSKKGGGVARRGDWKLFLRTGELFHLGEDIGEARDRAAAQTEVVAQLRAAYDVWSSAVDGTAATSGPPPAAEKKG